MDAGPKCRAGVSGFKEASVRPSPAFLTCSGSSKDQLWGVVRFLRGTRGGWLVAGPEAAFPGHRGLLAHRHVPRGGLLGMHNTAPWRAGFLRGQHLRGAQL